MQHDWLSTAQRIQSIAQAGITYCENSYDQERYEELLQLSARILSDYTEAPFERITDLFSREEGYLTPKVDVRGVIFRGGKLLMVQEKVDSRWTVPGGWADVGYSPSQIAVKEVQEEAGIEVVPEKLLAVLDKKCHPHPPTPFYTYKVFIQCRHVSGQIAPGMETKGVGFFGPEEIPPLSEERLTLSQVQLLFEFQSDPTKVAVFD